VARSGGSAARYDPRVGRDHGRRSLVDGSDNLGVIDPAQIHRGHAQVGMLDMRVIWQLVWRSSGGPCGVAFRAGSGYAVGAERRSA
jgi:hypothetical protein